MKITTVINTYNEERNIKRCLDSVKDFADEIIVVDMHSSDGTVEIAKKFKAKIFFHEYTRFVEPARNFALSKASGDWILLIDADEELNSSLADQLKRIVVEGKADYVEIPRKNMIFEKWINHSNWWPDYLVRFFKNGKVGFSEKIHVPPRTEGQGLRLEATEANAIVHRNYQSISQFIERLNRYTDIQSDELLKSGYKFDWKDLIVKPSNEFFSRFFAGEGYKDGIHGLALSSLQTFSELVLYLKIWEKEGFKQEDLKNYNRIALKSVNDYIHWLQRINVSFFSMIRLKLKAKI